MLFLTATTETFTLVTAAALSTDWSVGYVDMDTTVGATAGSAQGNVATATTTTVVAAPAVGVQRQLKSFTVVNKDASGTQTVTLNKVTGAGTFALGAARTVALAPGESLTYIDSVGFASFDSVGRLKVTNFGGIGASSATFARGDFTWSSTLVGPLTADRFIPASATVPTNGVYLPAANSVGIATNSTNAVTIDASGNVGVGASPTSPFSFTKFVAVNNATSASYALNVGARSFEMGLSASGGLIGTSSNDPFRFFTNGVEVGRFTAAGRFTVAFGFTPDAGGLKHARVTTGSVAAASTALVTVTWGTAFADTNYTVQASVLDSTTTSLALSVVHVESISTTAVTVRVLNNAAGALTGTLHVIALHD